ncbi:MAG: hypothetical protein DDT32_02175 [Syntrophomonadaceae bacterium]|nr:hypothetical protein [Bacillota bacterium]
MLKTQKKVVEEIKLLPEDMLECVFDFVEYVKVQRGKIQEFESKYGLLSNLEGKITGKEHSWQEEKEFFEWETALTEIEKIRKILKAKGENR